MKFSLSSCSPALHFLHAAFVKAHTCCRSRGEQISAFSPNLTSTVAFAQSCSTLSALSCLDSCGLSWTMPFPKLPVFFLVAVTGYMQRRILHHLNLPIHSLKYLRSVDFFKKACYAEPAIAHEQFVYATLELLIILSRHDHWSTVFAELGVVQAIEDFV